MDERAFATASDVAARTGQSLTPDLEQRMNTLCADASDVLRERWPDIDARVASGALRESTLRRIVATMVRRAVQNADSEGVASLGQGAGPFNTNVTFSNPDGALFVSSADVAILDANPPGRAFAVDLWQTPTPDWCG